MDNKDELIAKLERESSYLKSFLEQNGISYEEPKEIKQHNFSDAEKINLYLSYFVGKDDIFAYNFLKRWMIGKILYSALKSIGKILIS